MSSSMVSEKESVALASYEERIRRARTGLSPSFLRLANYLLDSYTESAFLTATELAHSLDIDPGTVVRFSQHLGYSGYPELQHEIRERVKREFLLEREQEPNSPDEAAVHAFDEIMQSLDLVRRSFPLSIAQEFVFVLDEVERVIVMAEGLAESPADTIAAYLEAAGYTVHRSVGGPAGLARAVAGAHKGDLALVVCVTEDTPFIAQALAGAREAGARTAAILASPSSESALYADLVLTGHAPSDPGVGQIILESMVYVLLKMLTHARPGRFKGAAERVQEMTQRLVGSPSA